MSIIFLTENIFDPSSTFVRRHIDALKDNIVCISTLHQEKSEYNSVPVYSLLNYFVENNFLKILKFIDRMIPTRYRYSEIYTCRKSLTNLLNIHHVDCCVIQFGWMASRAYKVLKNKNIPYIILIHGEDIHNASVKPNFPYSKRLRTAIEHSFKTLMVSKNVYSKALLLGCSKNKLELFYLGVPASDKKADPSKKSDTIRICNVGRLVLVKGQIILLEAMKILVEKKYCVKLTIIGDGPLKNEFEKWVFENKLTNFIDLKGSLDYNSVTSELSENDIYVHSSVTLPDGSEEALGLTILEAMSVGLPVVSLNNGGVAEVISENTGILVKQNNAESLAEAIEILIKDPLLRKQLGEEGARVMETSFNMTNQNEILKKLVSEMCKFS